MTPRTNDAPQRRKTHRRGGNFATERALKQFDLAPHHAAGNQTAYNAWMLDIVLFEPEIPPNTGNIIRLCANTGARLHLVEPLGFAFEDKALRRAGLDYHEFAQVRIHPDWPAVTTALTGRRWFAFSTRGTNNYHRVRFRHDDVLLFGPETRGLPQEVLLGFPAEQRLRIPMVAGSRSLNLSNTVALTLFEAWRQLDFAGATDRPDAADV